jgi:hypothetical protein
MESVNGIEPSSQPWEGHILRLNHTRASAVGIIILLQIRIFGIFNRRGGVFLIQRAMAASIGGPVHAQRFLRPALPVPIPSSPQT